MKKIHTIEIMQAFEKAGFRFHDFGTVKRGGKRIADYYKGDLTSDIGGRLKSLIPDCYFMTSRAEYAPEIVYGLVCIPR